MIKSTLEKIRANAHIRQQINNAGWLFIDRFVRLGIGLFVGVWVARYLGPEEFGQLNYVAALIALFSAFSTLGLDQIVIKKIIDDPEKQALYIGTSFYLRVFGGLIAMGICCIWVFFTEQDNTTLLYVTFLVSLISLMGCFDVIDYVFQSKLHSRKTVIAKNASFLIAALIKVWMLLTGTSLTMIVYAMVLEGFLGAVGLIFFYKPAQILGWRFDRVLAVNFLKESWPLIFSGVIVLLYMKLDQVMIAKMMDHKSVGLYSVSVRFTELWYFIPMILTSTLYPRLIALKDDSEKYLKLCGQLLKGLFVISFSIAVLMTFFSEHLILFLYGDSYLPAAFALKISIWTGIFVFWGVGAGNILVIENLNIHTFRKSLFGLILNIVLNIVLIPIMGINGAAIATLISQFYSSCFYYVTNAATRHIFWLQVRSILFYK